MRPHEMAEHTIRRLPALEGDLLAKLRHDKIAGGSHLQHCAAKDAAWPNCNHERDGREVKP